MSKVNDQNPCGSSCNKGVGSADNAGSENPNQSKRDFLKVSAKSVSALAVGTSFASFLSGCNKDNVEEMFQKHFKELNADELKQVVARLERQNKEKYGKESSISATPPMPGVVFGYGLDLSRCIGCRRCVHACVKENNQSRDPEIQWIRVLEFKKEKGVDLKEANPYYCSDDNSTGVPTPLTDKQQEVLNNPETQYPLYRADVNKTENSNCNIPRAEHFYMPVACQQCEDPPCTKVCPVQATWSEPDGIVVVDYNWCIGCRYCMAACPYGARHFNWTKPNLPAEKINPNQHYLGNRPRYQGVVEKCTFCIQKSRNGQYPACVEVCPVGSRKFGNLLDPESEIRYIMEHNRVFILKSELNTRPRFFYFYGR